VNAGTFLGANNAMSNRVKLKKSQLDYFRKLARKSDKEIMAYLVGEVKAKDLIVIDSFEYTKDYHTQTEQQVSWYVTEYNKVRERAEERGKSVIGYIHTHPQWDAVMSPVDYEGCVRDMHPLCGITSVNKGKTRTRFWVMDSSLPCDVIYVEEKRSSKTKRSGPEAAEAGQDQGL